MRQLEKQFGPIPIVQIYLNRKNDKKDFHLMNQSLERLHEKTKGDQVVREKTIRSLEQLSTASNKIHEKKKKSTFTIVKEYFKNFHSSKDKKKEK